MSKIETLRHLPTPADVRQNVRELGQMLAETSDRLDATAHKVQSLEQLPGLVAEQVTEALKALDPVLRMRQDVQTALEAFDQVTKVQRQTLEALVQELSSQAAESMEQKTASLTLTLESVTTNTQILMRDLKTSMTLMNGAVGNIQELPGQLKIDLSDSVKKLKAQAEKLETASNALKTETDRARERPRWRKLAELAAVAAGSAVLVLVGQMALNKILPPNDAKIWLKADEKERKALSQIVLRPDK